MDSPSITIAIPYDAYASLSDHGYCALTSKDDLIGESLNVGERVNAITESGDKYTIRLIARQQAVGIHRFTHIYAVAI